MSETPEVELARLKKEQLKARNDEIFIGTSAPERQQYDVRAKRIQVLLSNIADKKQRTAWGQTSETDTPQEESRQSYRSREENSSQAYTDSKAHSREVKRKKADTE